MFDLAVSNVVYVHVLICNIKEQKCLQYQTIFLVKTNFNICLSSDLHENVITGKVASHGAYQKEKNVIL